MYSNHNSTWCFPQYFQGFKSKTITPKRIICKCPYYWFIHKLSCCLASALALFASAPCTFNNRHCPFSCVTVTSYLLSIEVGGDARDCYMGCAVHFMISIAGRSSTVDRLLMCASMENCNRNCKCTSRWG